MAYDDELAARVRAQLAPMTGIDERRMFGGLAFLLDGNMAVVVRGAGGLMVRLDPDAHADVLRRPGAEPTIMRGREMRGWITLPPGVCDDPATVRAWVDDAVAHTSTLPPK
jgi:TfoX/Sxy family transcriptional regulator of competence genes